MSVGDLRLPCEHGRYDEHVHKDGRNLSQLKALRMSDRGESFADVEVCKSRHATVADLVSALRAEGVLVVEKDPDRQDWPTWAFEAMGVKRFGAAIERPYRGLLLDALAEAQPFPPAGGVS